MTQIYVIIGGEREGNRKGQSEMKIITMLGKVNSKVTLFEDPEIKDNI